jgi:hypothetical protein
MRPPLPSSGLTDVCSPICSMANTVPIEKLASKRDSAAASPAALARPG